MEKTYKGKIKMLNANIENPLCLIILKFLVYFYKVY